MDDINKTICAGYLEKFAQRIRNEEIEVIKIDHRNESREEPIDYYTTAFVPTGRCEMTITFQVLVKTR